MADGGDVGDEDLAEARAERGGEVADLVGVGEDDVCGRDVADELLEREDVAVGGVDVEERVGDGVDLAERCGGDLWREGFGVATDDGGCAGSVEVVGDLAGGGEGFEAHGDELGGGGMSGLARLFGF